MSGDSELNEKLGRLLKTSREAAGLTQREVASRLGYTSPQYVSNWERGRVAPPMSKIAKVVDIVKGPSTKVQNLLIAHTTQSIKNTFNKKDKSSH